MIERATQRRLAGDWRGACAAAGVDIEFDLAEVANRHGGEVAAALEDDLAHFAPDLLRWHAPRVDRGHTSILPDQVLVLDYASPGGVPSGNAACLHVTTPPSLVYGPQRLTLGFGPVPDRWTYLDTDVRYAALWRGFAQHWTAARHLWDARHADELRERCGGGKTRAPFLEPDGTPRPPKLLPTSAPGGDDPAALAEWATLLHERGDVEAAFAAAGVEVDGSFVDLDEWSGGGSIDPVLALARIPLALTGLEPEARRLSEQGHGHQFWIPYTQHAAVLLDCSDGLRIGLEGYDGFDTQMPVLPDAGHRRLPDLELLRAGRMPLDHLHPLVRAALAPAASSAGPEAGGGPPGPEAPSPYRVRCRGEWHEVAFRDGALELPHTAEEHERERALLALGGALGGCFAVQHEWRTGGGRLPKALDRQRRDLWTRVLHGDTPGVLALLDAGIDPHVRDPRGRTLMHALHLLDHEQLMPRLLAAGLGLEARDRNQRTPLHVAVFEDGPVPLVKALLDAGARIDVQDDEETTLYRVISWRQRFDLGFLEDLIERDHPEVADL